MESGSHRALVHRRLRARTAELHGGEVPATTDLAAEERGHHAPRPTAPPSALNNNVH
ncbi:hypothetical protein ANO14919_061570 [Xylariales sp. No.14919]|nr:hypothetical protein ANO14919_061570 [Xylariales sp. No.14919]